MGRTKEIKLAPLTIDDLESVTDGQFKDTYGNVVKHGDKILIEHNYNYQHFNNREALVEWNPQKGMYNYVFIDDTRFKSRNDFYGVYSFKLIHCQHLETETYFMGGSEYSTMCKRCKKTLDE